MQINRMNFHMTAQMMQLGVDLRKTCSIVDCLYVIFLINVI